MPSTTRYTHNSIDAVNCSVQPQQHKCRQLLGTPTAVHTPACTATHITIGALPAWVRHQELSSASFRKRRRACGSEDWAYQSCMNYHSHHHRRAPRVCAPPGAVQRLLQESAPGLRVRGLGVPVLGRDAGHPPAPGLQAPPPCQGIAQGAPGVCAHEVERAISFDGQGSAGRTKAGSIIA